MTYLKSTAVGIVAAIIFAAAWTWAALEIPIWWQMWQQRNQGGVGSSSAWLRVDPPRRVDRFHSRLLPDNATSVKLTGRDARTEITSTHGFRCVRRGRILLGQGVGAGDRQ